MNYPVSELDKITPGIGDVLKSNKIRTTARLIENARTPKKRQTLADKTGIPVSQILRCVTMADRLRVKGVGRDHAELLEVAGVKTVQDLRYRNPANLAEAIAEANGRRKCLSLLPSEKVIARWIADAKKLKNEVSY
jgi:predicted NBD/HSP70 family sugar kinase